MLRLGAFPVMRMRWRYLLFAHWRIDASALRHLVPAALEIDTFDGCAWVGLIPFTMEDVSPVVLPRVPLRSVTDFHECNVRTYVYPRGRQDDMAEPGVWFFSLDAASRIGVWGARTFFGLPYFHARMHMQREGDTIDYGTERIALCKHLAAALHCRWHALEAMPQSRPGELAHFLTERYCLYSVRGGSLHRARIAHQPWPLRRAALASLDDSLVAAAGISGGGLDQAREPVLYHVDSLDVRVGRLERV